MSFASNWTLHRSQFGGVWRRYQQWFGGYIPLYDDEFQHHRWIEITTFSNPPHVRVYMRIN